MTTARVRQDEILDRLRAEQREWRVDEIADRLSVSSITIRRDLEELAQQGRVLRTHGGCLYAGRVAQDSSYHARVSMQFDLKRAIGRQAVRQIRGGEMILIDDGSTCFHVAAQLDRTVALSLYTNSMPVVSELAGSPLIQVSLLGGGYDATRQHLGGPLTEWALERLTFDRVFLGSDAIDEEGRCRVRTEELARTAQAMLKSGRRKVLLADHTKCGQRADAGRVGFGCLADFDEWITTGGLPPAWLRKFQRMTSMTVVES